MITRIESREVFEVPKRVQYIWNLKGGVITFYVEGREMNEEKEIGAVLANYIRALHAAEQQIECLMNVINESTVDKDYLNEYMEEYPEDEEYVQKYEIEDIKEALFNSMMKKDEKKTSYWINQLHVVTEKLKS